MMTHAMIARDRLTEQEFVALHTTHIGGSTIAAVCGVHPFKSRLQVWLEMTGREPVAFAPSRRMQLGLALEQPMLEQFHLRTGLAVHEPGLIFASARNPRCIATPDGVYWRENLARDGVYECKVSTRIAEWEQGMVSEAYCQCQWYMGVIELKESMVCCFPNTHENLEHVINGTWADIPLYIEQIERDDELIEAMFEEAEAFLALVDSDTPPVDATTPRRDLQKLYPQDSGQTVELGDELARLVAAHTTASAQRKQAEAAQAGVEAAIMALLQQASYGTIAGTPAVSWKAHTRESLDSKRLKVDHPALYATYTTRSQVRPLRLIHPK
jgi:predicted phage-related endonuclease